MKNIVLMGPAGSGKGTQAEYIVKNFGLLHLSTGEMLRAEVATGSELGLEIKKVIDDGFLVSDDLMVKLIKNRIEKEDAKNGVIFDGFPRTLEQAIALDKMLNDINKSISHVIYLYADDSILLGRITGRYACSKCGAGYHDISKKPKKEGVCDKCGSSDFFRRDDDNAEAVTKRLKIFHDLTKAVIPYYKEQGKVFEVDGEKEITIGAEQINKILTK